MPVKSFDDFDDMFKYMEDQEKLAAENVRLWQVDMRVGDCYLSVREDLDVEIVGEILDPGPEDREYFKKSAYRWVHAYSAMCVEGEKGSAHISTFTKKITREQFEEVKKILKKWANGKNQ